MRRSIFSGAGYLWSDDRCSGGKFEESDLLGCGHCQKLIRKSEWKADGGFCHSCDAPVCTHCADRIPQHGCEVFMRQLEGAIEKHYRQQQNAKILGITYDQE